MALAALAIAVAASTAWSQQGDAAAIRAASDQWQRDIAAKNVDAIVALHAPDAIVLMSHAPIAKGSTAIRGMWAEGVKTPGLVLSWTPATIEVVSPTRAIEYGNYTESYDTPQGKGTDAGGYVTVWHKINGKWRVAIDAPVTSAPLPDAAAAAAPMDAKVQELANSALAWSDFNLPGFDPGVKLAVLSGDPGAKGPYVLRLQFPAGYRFPVHWHPGVENLTVVSGQFQLAMGNTADWATLKTYGPGDFLYIPPRHAHFGGSGAQGSVVQLHGVGPFQVILGPPK
jgi:ketosteroid isomerase-like protein/quercetin dioxygenase-like cupin family protein